VPLERALDPYDAWITGVRREETDARSDTQVVEWDPKRAMVKVNPIAGWTQEQVDAYIAEHGVVLNPLVDEGYPSIGCATCTLPGLTGSVQVAQPIGGQPSAARGDGRRQGRAASATHWQAYRLTSG